MKNIKLNFFFLLLIGASSSCTYVYYPNYPVIPQVKENGGGFQATVGFSKAQISGWYCKDSNLFFTGTVSGAVAWLEEVTTDSNNNKRPYRTLTGTAGVGYQTTFAQKGHFQILGGGGMSQGHLYTSLFNPTDGNNYFDAMEVDYQSARFYLQPSVGTAGKDVGFYFIPRFTYEKFTRVEPSKKKLPLPMVKRSYIVAEPFAMLRVFSKVVNVDFYGGISMTLNSDQPTSGDVILVTQPVTFGVGISKVF